MPLDEFGIAWVYKKSDETMVKCFKLKKKLSWCQSWCSYQLGFLPGEKLIKILEKFYIVEMSMISDFHYTLFTVRIFIEISVSP